MTEVEWQGCNAPAPMLAYLRGPGDAVDQSHCLHSHGCVIVRGFSDKVSRRKLLLFGAACNRRLWEMAADEPSRRALTVYELYANGDATQEDCFSAYSALHWFIQEGGKTSIPLWIGLSTGDPLGAAQIANSVAWSRADEVAKAPVAAIRANATEDDLFAYGFCGYPDPLWIATRQAEERIMANLLREILGNPFQPKQICAQWLIWSEATVRRIAQAIYDEGAFDRMPILADALEDAGCNDADILRHCREPGEHVRGCWVIDLLLGKE